MPVRFQHAETCGLVMSSVLARIIPDVWPLASYAFGMYG